MNLLTHDTEKLLVFNEGTTRRSFLTAQELQSLVTELGSWTNFLSMLRYGGTALMTAYIAKRPQRMKVCRIGSVPEDATYETV